MPRLATGFTVSPGVVMPRLATGFTVSPGVTTAAG
jgi:hypothetical protein